MKNIAVCACGLKGLLFLRQVLSSGIPLSRIFSYKQDGDLAESFDSIAKLAQKYGIELVEEKKPSLEGFLTLLVGWQYLMREPSTGDIIVFHDSLLPRYRGFSPTVAALINGEAEIGVTAFRATEAMDEGLVVGRRAITINYPIKIAQALQLQAEAMADLAVDICAKWKSDSLAFYEQDHSHASYSIWRDDRDYDIDWSWDAKKLSRLIDAVGYPYPGARTMMDGKSVIIQDAVVSDEVAFESRHPGKVWKFDNGHPVVVCGKGMLRLDRIIDASGETLEVRKLRSRFGA